MKNFIVLCFVFVGVFAEDALPPPQIIGGTDAKLHEFPWQASIKKIGFDHWCGGSLINNQWVLTAAHCFIQPRSFKVHLGSHFTNETVSGEEVFGITHVVSHHLYGRKAYEHDIALLKLDRKVKYSGAIKPIELAGKGQSPLGKDVVISGWGSVQEVLFNNGIARVTFCGRTYTFHRSSNNPKFLRLDCGHLENINDIKVVARPRTLQQVSVPVVPDDQCIGRLAVDYGEKTWCVGNNHQGGCYGDSGGPMALKVNGKWTLFGITSYGDEFCIPAKQPTKFTKVNEYRDWIAKIVKDYN